MRQAQREERLPGTWIFFSMPRDVVRRLDQRGWTRCNVCVKNLTARSVANGLQRGSRRKVKEGGEPRSKAEMMGTCGLLRLEARGPARHAKRKGRRELRMMPPWGASLAEWVVVLVYEVGGISARLEISVRLR